MIHPLQDISPEQVPQRFTYPFNYEAHPLCVYAAEQLQKQLKAWQWNDGCFGKMFGVMIVQLSQDNYAYLWAYSGNITEGLDAKSFVPPIFDLLAPDSFFPEGEAELTALNKTIEALENSRMKLQLEEQIEKDCTSKEAAMAHLKNKHQKTKKDRKKRRQEHPSAEILHDLNLASQKEKIEMKKLRILWDERIKQMRQQLQIKQDEILDLKAKRKEKSKHLQDKLFNKYQLLNANCEVKSLVSIFKAFSEKAPPAAAGDCAAPRLLQYAYKNNLKPIAMAEFWWGKSPQTVIRRSGNYYPSCRSKCEPILHHMLQGLDIEDNPLLTNNKPQYIDTIYEDDSLMVVNKPAGLLSVKGKSKLKSLVEILQEQHASLKELHIVHRLDMATSGLILLAKNKAIYKKLQAQFLQRTVKKRYEALLDGTLSTLEGKIDLPLRVDLDNRPQQMVCYDYGKPALTVWRKLDEKEGKTRVAFYPQTGRTHQLRVHAAHPLGLNTPIVGDDLYGTRANRLYLHAAALEFTHPTQGKRIKVKCPIPF